MARSVDDQIAFLAAHGAGGHPHSESSLLDHLEGTRRILVSWGASADLCTAGLFHSVYGTESYPLATIDPDLRHTVRELIGLDAERLVYLFSVMSRESFEHALVTATRTIKDRTTGAIVDLDADTFRDLCTLSAANWLEQFDRVPAIYRRLGAERYARVLNIVTAAAAEAIRAACEAAASGEEMIFQPACRGSEGA